MAGKQVRQQLPSLSLHKRNRVSIFMIINLAVAKYGDRSNISGWECDHQYPDVYSLSGGCWKSPGL